MSTIDPTPDVDFIISGVKVPKPSGGFDLLPFNFNKNTGELSFSIPRLTNKVFIATTALADAIEIDPETIQFNWGVNAYPNIEFVGSGAVNIADQAEGIGLTANPDFTYEFWEADAPGVFHIKPDDETKKLCTSVRLRIDASAKDAAAPNTDYWPNKDYGLVTETGVALQLTEEVPGSRIYISQQFQISEDKDFQVYATAINDRIREGDEFVRAELVVPALPNENDKATVTIKEEYYKAEIRKEEKQAPECNCTCPVCDGELIQFDIENQDVKAPIADHLLGTVSDPLRSAYPVARLVIPLPSNKAVPTSIDVELYTVVKNSNAPFGRDVKRVLKSFTIYPSTLLSEGANPRAPQPGDKLFVNFQLDLLPEMLSGGASSNTNIELLASPTFAPTTNYLQKFSGWWGSAPFTTSNPFALEQLTGLPAAINWALDRLYASQEILVPDPADNGKLIPETGTTLSRRDGSESWFKNGSVRPPETLSKLSSNTLTLRDGAKTIFSGSPSGYASSSVDQSGNVSTYSMIKALSSWGTGAAGTMTDAYGRINTVTYGAPAANGTRTFSIADPWGAVTTVTWTPNGGVWAPAYNLPVGYNLWRIDASASSMAYTVSNGGVLSVLYPDPDGTGPRKALQNVYNFSSNWFLSGITSGEVGQAPIQTYSFAHDFDLAKPPGEIGSRAMLSITHNDITTTIDFARRRQDLGQYSLPLGAAHKALLLKSEDLIANPGVDLSPYYDITSYTDGNGNRTLYRMDHRGRAFQVMDAYFVKLLGLDTLDLSVSANLSLVNQKLKANASITTQYVLSPVFRDPWGRVIGEDRGEVLVARLPDPDDFSLRTDLPAADRTNGPLSRPQYTSAFSEGNRTNLLSPLTNVQNWVYNDQFDIPTLYTDEHGIQTVQTVDTTIGRVTHQRSGNTTWQNAAQLPDVDSTMDVDNDGEVNLLDLLTVINYINSGAPSVLPAYRTVDSFLDVNGDGSVNAMDSQPIWDYFRYGGPSRFPILGPNRQSMVDYEYTSTGTLPRGLLTKQSVYTGRGTIANPDNMVTSYAYYNVPGDPSKHGMISSITEAPNTAVTAVTAYEYDSRANVNKVTDSMGRVTKYFYDKLDRLTSIIGPDPDGAGLLISPMVRYDYNVYGRLIATEVINSTIDSTGALFVTSLVDGNSYDNFQRLTGEFQQKGETIWYVTGISATGVTRSLTPAVPTSIDLQALAAANTRISTSSAANSTVTPVTDTANQGLVKKYQYDKNHNMVSVEVSNAGVDARITKITYDRANRPVMVVTPNPGGSEAQNVAGEIRNTNAAAGEIGGYVTTTIFDNINQTWRTTDTQGTAINYRYDDLGRTKSVTVPGPTIGAAALTTQYSYTSVSKTGWLVQQTDPNLHISSVQYDYLGNVIKSTAPDGGVMGATYFGDGQVRRPVMSAEPDTEVRVGYADYDVRGRRTILSDLYGETSFSYRVDGSLNSVTDSMSRTISFTYDAAGRVTKQTSPDPDGTGPLLAAASYRSFDSLGNVLNSHNDTSTGTTLAYDGRFRAISSTDSDAAATLFKYNVYGQTTQVEDAKQNKTTFDYDRLNRQFKETKIGYGSRTTTLDGVGNVQSYVDRNGRTTLYEYNKLYDVTKETWVNPAEGNGVNYYEYDATGRLVSASDNKANSNIFTYDINDRVDTERVFIAGVSPYVGAVLLDNDFNQRGLRTKVSTTIGTTVDAVNDYAYDNRNMMTSVKQSGANVTDKLVNFTYNASGQLDKIDRFKTLTPQSLVASSKYQYDGAGRVQVITHSKTAISTGWNGTDVSTTTTDPILAAYFLKYDQSNRVTSFASRFDGFSTAYGYDTRDQLTGATTTPLAGATVAFMPPTENYVFDKTGNRTNGGTSTSANETHNRVQNDGTNTYLYDNEGNQISRTNNSTGEVTTYSYDYRNRLIKVASPGKVVSYQYDAFDRRIRKLVDDGGNGSIDSRTAWVWDGNQVIFQFKDPDGEGVQLPFKLTNRYLYGDIVDLILADEQVGVPGTGGGSVGDPMSFPIGSTGSVSTEGLYRILWPLSDHLGTVRDLVDSNGTRLEHRVYDSFGKLLVETEDFTSSTGSTGGSVGMPVGGGGGGGTTTDAIDSIFGYTGREWDKDVKLQFNRARWYDPATGRWISQDPIGFAGGDANLYRYVGNSPTNFTDPNGLEKRWFNDDWTDWINPASWLAAGSDPIGERIGTGFGAAVNFGSEWGMNNRLHELREQRIANGLLSNSPNSISATNAIGASAGSKFRVVTETIDDTSKVADGLVATAELGVEVALTIAPGGPGKTTALRQAAMRILDLIGSANLPYRTTVTNLVKLSRFFATRTGYQQVIKHSPITKWAQANGWQSHHWAIPRSTGRAGSEGLRRVTEAGWNLIPLPARWNRAISNGGLGYNATRILVGTSPVTAAGGGYALGSSVYDTGVWLWCSDDE